MRGSGLDLTAYGDTDYADKPNDRRSVSGTVMPWGVRPSVGQVARRGVLHRAEAEYVTYCGGVKEVLSTGGVLSFINQES